MTRVVPGFSANADRSVRLHWLRSFKKPPKRAFVVQGEPVAADSLAQALRHDLGWPTVIVPDYGESDILFTASDNF